MDASAKNNSDDGPIWPFLLFLLVMLGLPTSAAIYLNCVEYPRAWQEGYEAGGAGQPPRDKSESWQRGWLAGRLERLEKKP